MAEVAWSVAYGANAVTFTPGSPTQHPRPAWAARVRGHLPSGQEVTPLAAGDSLYFSPPLPPGSTIEADGAVLHVVA